MTLRAKAEAARTATTATWRPTTRWSHDDLEAFHAAASPDVVLGLLDRVEALRELALEWKTCEVVDTEAWQDGARIRTGPLRCLECNRERDVGSDAPDDHEPGCLVRREP